MMRYHYTSIRMTKIKNAGNTRAGKDTVQLALLCLVAKNEKRYRHFGKQFGNFLTSNQSWVFNLEILKKENNVRIKTCT